MSLPDAIAELLNSQVWPTPITAVRAEFMRLRRELHAIGLFVATAPVEYGKQSRGSAWMTTRQVVALIRHPCDGSDEQIDPLLATTEAISDFLVTQQPEGFPCTGILMEEPFTVTKVHEQLLFESARFYSFRRIT